MQAGSKVMQGYFFCRECENCDNFFEIEDECKVKGLLTFNKEVMNWEVFYRGKSKHFKIIPRV